jgi:hypothetical protein
MKQLFTVLACISLVGFVSCQKDITDQLTQETNPADTLLSKVLTYDTTAPGKNMTLTEFMYDNQKRVTEIKDIYFDSANGSTTIHDQVSTYFYYNGTDKKPYKSYGWTRYVYADVDVFHFYDDKGRPIRDSIGAPDQSYLLARFHYTQDKLVITSTFYDENDLAMGAFSDSCYFVAGNMSKAFISFSLTQLNETAFEYTYDNKINPLSKLNIAACLGMDKYTTLDKFWILPSGFSKNNIVKRLGYEDYPGGQSYLTEYKFTYNDNNLPVFGIFTVNGVDREGIRTVYEYTD